MCTVSLIRVPRNPGANPSGAEKPIFRLACNRDESRKRPVALPPEIRVAGERRLIMPVDPTGGGTWIAVNDSGVVATLLNIYPNPGNPELRKRNPNHRSRGEIIPRLLECSTMENFIAELRRVSISDYPGFRLVATDGHTLLHSRSDNGEMQIDAKPWDFSPKLYTSSGLGDSVVEPPRRTLFDRTLRLTPTPETQDDFHRDQDATAPHLSVCMARPDARTVSYTTVDVSTENVTLGYYDVAPNEEGRWHRVSLPRRANKA